MTKSKSYPLERREGFWPSYDSGPRMVPKTMYYWKCLECGEAHRHKHGFKHDPKCKFA